MPANLKIAKRVIIGHVKCHGQAYRKTDVEIA